MNIFASTFYRVIKILFSPARQSVTTAAGNFDVTDLSIHTSSNFRTALHDILGGTAASVLTVAFGLSYSLLIFAGPLAPYLSYGVATTFLTSAILGVVLALRSSFPFAIGAPETSTAAMTGLTLRASE